MSQSAISSDIERAAAITWARDNLYDYSRWIFLKRKGFKWLASKHHEIICDALMRVYRGEISRLIINVPPRYSKTEIAVINFITWSLGKVPDAEYIYTSYSGRLATTNAWIAREIVQSAEYRAIFPGTVLHDEGKARDEWRTTEGGCVYAVGAGGTITGYGAGKMRPGFAGAVIVDDPLKADEARSDIVRNNVNEWFMNTLESRKNSPETPVVLIMQRLHEDDLSGFLLSGGNGEHWEHLCLPAIKEDGTALWEAKHPLETLLAMQEASPYNFSGQYMQHPAPPEGNIFKPDQMPIVDAIPNARIEYVRGWDLGASINGDYTVGAKVGRLPDGRYVIADIVRVQKGPDDRDAVIKNTASVDGNATRIDLPKDPGQAGTTQIAYLTRELVGYRVQSSPESGDKITRAEPFAAQVNVGNVLMLKAPWNRELLNEMRMFPNSKHDDQVDALSRAFAAVMGRSPMRIDQRILRAV